VITYGLEANAAHVPVVVPVEIGTPRARLRGSNKLATGQRPSNLPLEPALNLLPRCCSAAQWAAGGTVATVATAAALLNHPSHARKAAQTSKAAYASKAAGPTVLRR
jgi:hypothetical protein